MERKIQNFPVTNVVVDVTACRPLRPIGMLSRSSFNGTLLSPAIILACLASLLFSKAASAQRHPIISSIEHQVVHATSIYVGTVSTIGPPSASDISGLQEAKLTVEVSETLKGEARKKFQAYIYFPPASYLSDYQEWSRRKTPLLWFIKEDEAKDAMSDSGTRPTEPPLPLIKTWNSLPADPAWNATPQPYLGYFSMDWRILTSPRQILDVIRRTARKYPMAKPQTLGLYFMPNLVHRLFPYNAGGELLVPVNPDLEKIAHRMIHSPGSMLPSEREIKGISHDEYLKAKAVDENTLRRMGVQALSFFKSDANIALLKRQLADPFIEQYISDPPDYTIRKFAYKALQKWGVVDIPKPELLLPQKTP